MEVRVFRSAGEIEPLKSNWDALLAETGGQGIFSSYAWISNTYRRLERRGILPLLLAVFDDARELAGIFPFAVGQTRFKGASVRSLIGGGSDRADYASFLVAGRINARLAIGRVVTKLLELNASGEWSLFALDNFSESDNVAGVFRDLLLRQSYGGTVRTMATPRIRFDSPFEEAKKTSDLKRRFRKFQNLGGVEVQIGLTPDASLMSRLADLYRKSNKRGLLDSDDGQQFFVSLIEDPAFISSVEVSIIEHKSRLVAAHFGFRSPSTIYHFLPMYDQEFSRYGLGQYLLWQMVNHYRDRGLLEFDFLRGGEDYKYQWMNSGTCNYRIWAVALGSSWWLKGMVAILLMRDTLWQLGSRG